MARAALALAGRRCGAAPMSGSLLVWAPDGVPEVAAGDDLGRPAARRAGRRGLRAGRRRHRRRHLQGGVQGRGPRGRASTARRRSPPRPCGSSPGAARPGSSRPGTASCWPPPASTRSGTEPGTVLLLPVDPDASARAAAARLLELAGVDVAVVVTDTIGRPWRTGQTDLAIGVAGLAPLDDLRGRDDGYGNVLEVTVAAVADEVAVRRRAGQGQARPAAGRGGPRARRTAPRARTARAPRPWSARPTRTCSGSAPATCVAARAHGARVHRRAGRPRRGPPRRRRRRHRARAAPHDAVAVRPGRRPERTPVAARRDARRLGRRPAPRRLHRRAGRPADPARRRAARRRRTWSCRAWSRDGVHDYPDERRAARRARDVPRGHGRRRREPAGRAGRRGTRLGLGEQHDVLPRRGARASSTCPTTGTRWARSPSGTPATPRAGPPAARPATTSCCSR